MHYFGDPSLYRLQYFDQNSYAIRLLAFTTTTTIGLPCFTLVVLSWFTMSDCCYLTLVYYNTAILFYGIFFSSWKKFSFWTELVSDTTKPNAGLRMSFIKIALTLVPAKTFLVSALGKMVEPV